MSKIRLGVLGGGGDSLIGVLHRVASYMYDRYEIVGGVFNPDYEENIKFAKSFMIRRCYLSLIDLNSSSYQPS